MIRLWFVFLLALITLTGSIASSNHALAQGGGADSGSVNGGSGQQCDFEGFLDALGQRESSNNYQARRAGSQFLGRWQLGHRSALIDAGWVGRDGVWTGPALNFNVRSPEDFLNNNAAQDAAVRDWFDVLAKRVEGFNLDKYIGQNIGGCEITWSGLLAGRHLCGFGRRSGGGGTCAGGTSLIQYLESGGSVVGRDALGTPVSEYVCRFGGYSTPYENGATANECGGEDPVPEDMPPQEDTGGGLPFPGIPGGSHLDREDDFASVDRAFNDISETLKYIWVGAFQNMTNSLTTMMLQQAQIIGSFFDAKHQLETQRLHQEKSALAHKDYHPSVQMCEIGTFVRNLADSEKRADLTQAAVNRSILDRTLITGEAQKTSTVNSDDDTRLKDFTEKFCDPTDNANGNNLLCGNGGDADQQNADINFTQTIDAPLTLNINTNNPEEEPTKEQENIFAFLDYLFTHDSFPWTSKNKTPLHAFIEPYQDMRSLVAMRSVAHNSFAHIISQKTQGTDNPQESAAPFLKSLLLEMGIRPEEIESTIGKNPSYFAQMEILTKKIYQHPEFISNLYDKPANVKRLRATMTAIKLMQDRDIHEALMRREMLISMILELKLRDQQKDLLNTDIRRVLANPPGEPNRSSGGGGGGGGGGGF